VRMAPSFLILRFVALVGGASGALLLGSGARGVGLASGAALLGSGARGVGLHEAITGPAKQPLRGCRRAVLTGAAAALVAAPRAAMARFGDGCAECTNTETETSPLIEELKRRSVANKDANAAAVKELTARKNPVYTESVKMVRYMGENDTVPVTRMMTTQQVAEIEKLGFKVECPSWGGACEVIYSKSPDAPAAAPEALAEPAAMPTSDE